MRQLLHRPILAAKIKLINLKTSRLTLMAQDAFSDLDDQTKTLKFCTEITGLWLERSSYRDQAIHLRESWQMALQPFWLLNVQRHITQSTGLRRQQQEHGVQWHVVPDKLVIQLDNAAVLKLIDVD